MERVVTGRRVVGSDRVRGSSASVAARQNLDDAYNSGPDYDADPDVANVAFEQHVTDDLDEFVDPALAATRRWIAREYVWGPGDGPGGVDELLAQYAGAWGWDRTKAWWVLQDGGGDCVAVCDRASDSSPARVDAQWTFDAYGNVLTAEQIVSGVPNLHCGHKGLFIDRLDGGVAPNANGGETPRLERYALGVYQNRNRAYSPTLGRFLQQDPNATAMALVGMAHGGGELGALASAFDIGVTYGDGGSLYEYLSSNGWIHQDPSGLWVAEVASLGAEMVLRGLRGGLENMIEHYEVFQEDDLDWAMDWEQRDDWHSRLNNSWVSESFHDGMMNGIRETLWDFIDPLGIRHWFEEGGGEETEHAQGSLLSGAYRLARMVKRISPAARIAVAAAKKLRLVASTSAAEIARVFKQIGYKVNPHFIDRLRGVGKAADAARMGSLGLRTVDDVLEILRRGKVVAGKVRGTIEVAYRGAKIVIEEETKMIKTIMHDK